jgi:hypothetical protein
MDDWNEEFLSYEVEKELAKHKADREKWNLEPGTSATATGTNSIWRILLGLIIGLIILIMICLLLIK